MACPSGCTNGGGQIKPSQIDAELLGDDQQRKSMDSRDILDKVEEYLGSLDKRHVVQGDD
jgi:iron only hydrogenase large subunit-like protein